MHAINDPSCPFYLKYYLRLFPRQPLIIVKGLRERLYKIQLYFLFGDPSMTNISTKMTTKCTKYTPKYIHINYTSFVLYLSWNLPLFYNNVIPFLLFVNVPYNEICGFISNFVTALKAIKYNL